MLVNTVLELARVHDDLAAHARRRRLPEAQHLQAIGTTFRLIRSTLS